MKDPGSGSQCRSKDERALGMFKEKQIGLNECSTVKGGDLRSGR